MIERSDEVISDQQRCDQVRGQTRDRGDLEAIIEQPDQHDQCRRRKQGGGDEFAAGSRPTPKMQPTNIARPPTTGISPWWVLRPPGLSTSSTATATGRKRRHRQQCCEKTRQAGAEIANQDIPQLSRSVGLHHAVPSCVGRRVYLRSPDRMRFPCLSGPARTESTADVHRWTRPFVDSVTSSGFLAQMRKESAEYRSNVVEN